ncbi:MAG: hypothetical protein K5895_07010 [Lachnospiraceae bacterium]|jgi:hypothetical protein|nr:hypothetical protein [Lachnospiraceae bacterium]
MQYIVKCLVICTVDIILGAFLGMIISIGNGMMHGYEQPLMGCVVFYGTIVAGFIYCFLLKKFALGEELSIYLPAICLMIGIYIGYTCNVYTV